jgi:nucleotide-binding universal stress UspA family protein
MQTIVVGYDDSEPANRALDRATELIDDGGTLILVSAIHMLAGKGGMGFDPIEKETFDQQLDAAKARLAEKGIAATTVEGMGDPARVITEQAKEAGADLIVVGNGHKNLLERLLFGSVSDGVSHRTNCDVLVVDR